MRNPLLFLALLVPGCTLHALPIADTPLDTSRKLATAQHTQKSILLLPFEDDRGADYMHLSWTTFTPVIHLFHDARDVYYPDHGLLKDGGRRRGFMLTGSIASAMPTILAHAVKAMGLSDDALSASWSAEPRDYDYVLVGRLKRTHFRDDQSGFVGLVLGPLGVPRGAAKYDLEYEVTLLDGHDRTHVLFKKTYAWNGKRVMGTYYNRNWAYQLFKEGLDTTVPEVVSDLATAMNAQTQVAMAP